MASTAAPLTAAPATPQDGVSLARLYVLRAMYLLLVVGLGVTILPQLIDHEATARGVIAGVLSGIWLLALLGLRYPLQMLPLLMFELGWKTVWLLLYGLPQWLSGLAPATFAEDFKAIVLGVILVPLVIPWGYVFRQYIKQPPDSASVDSDVSRVRLNVMRGFYLLLTIAGTFIIGRMLLQYDSVERGVFASMLVAMWLLSLLVLRNPLKMLPIILLEFVWKTIWLFAFGLPQWLAGVGSPRLSEDLLSVGGGPILFGLIIPWGYVYRHYIKQPSQRWR